MTSQRQREWVATMRGAADPSGVVLAHRAAPPPVVEPHRRTRQEREDQEAATLVPGATLAVGAGNRALPEEPDPLRTCFERDRDRILHSTAFRRLAGKTQVVVFPADHQRTRLTHALEVAQVATAVARAVGLNVALTEAMALGHDCGHGPGGHASEDAFDQFLPDGYHHAVWGADVVLAPLNLCQETLDGIRNHSWSRPTPTTPEGAVVSWADRIAYTAHDLEDAVVAGVVDPDLLPDDVARRVGRDRREQLHALIGALIDGISTTGVVGMADDHAHALAELRAFNYAHIYDRPESIAQGRAVVEVLTALVHHFAEHPQDVPADPGAAVPDGTPTDEAPVRHAVGYVAGMTDRFAFDTAVRLLDWPVDRIPRGFDGPGR